MLSYGSTDMALRDDIYLYSTCCFHMHGHLALYIAEWKAQAKSHSHLTEKVQPLKILCLIYTLYFNTLNIYHTLHQ